jgi:hypothetical protein
VYSGDSKYPAGTDASTGECFNVVAFQSHIGTSQIWSVYDTATVTVDAAAGTVKGSVEFKLFNSSNCSTTPLMTSTKSISGNSGVSVSSDTYPSSGGAASQTYYWLVKYTPDSDRPAQIAATGTCGNENTVLTITDGSSQP